MDEYNDIKTMVGRASDTKYWMAIIDKICKETIIVEQFCDFVYFTKMG